MEAVHSMFSRDFKDQHLAELIAIVVSLSVPVHAVLKSMIDV